MSFVEIKVYYTVSLSRRVQDHYRRLHCNNIKCWNFLSKGHTHVGTSKFVLVQIVGYTRYNQIVVAIGRSILGVSFVGRLSSSWIVH